MVTHRAGQPSEIEQAALAPVGLPALVHPQPAELTAQPLGSAPCPMPAERTLESRELLAGGREVRIRHGADFYRLRVTQNGKLILQK